METMKKTTWLLWASIIVTILTTLYLYLHFSTNTNKKENATKESLNGVEIQYLDKTQLNVITLLINNNDLLLKDSVTNKEEVQQKTRILIVDFLKENFDLKYKNENRIIKRVMETDFGDLQAILPTYPIHVDSFFWLTSPGILLEVVFWSLFGLMASLLFGVTSAAVFDPKLIPEHIGKFFYTPFLVVIIYLSLNALTNEGSITLEGEGKGTIVLAFVLGFYTRRAIILLGRIKDIILPAKDREPQTIPKTAEDDTYKELSIDDQKVVIDEFLNAQSAVLLTKYPAIKLINKALKPASEKKEAYYFLQINLKENSSGEGIPSVFEYTNTKGATYKIPSHIIKTGI